MRKLDRIAGDIIECCVPKEQITEDVKREFGVLLREFRETLDVVKKLEKLWIKGQDMS